MNQKKFSFKTDTKERRNKDILGPCVGHFKLQETGTDRNH